jgi:adenylate cyclase
LGGVEVKNQIWRVLDLGLLRTAVAGFMFKNWTWWLYKDLDSPYNCFGHV